MERWRALKHLDEWLRTPMLLLSLAWLALIVIDLTVGTSPLLAFFTTVIWIIFIAEFAVRFPAGATQTAFSQAQLAHAHRPDRARVAAVPGAGDPALTLRARGAGLPDRDVRSFFIGRDAEEEDGPVAGAAELHSLKQEVAALRRAIESANARSGNNTAAIPPA